MQGFSYGCTMYPTPFLVLVTSDLTGSCSGCPRRYGMFRESRLSPRPTGSRGRETVDVLVTPDSWAPSVSVHDENRGVEVVSAPGGVSPYP